LTCPFELRARLGFDAKLLSELWGVVNDALLDFYQRALRERVGPLQTSVDGFEEARESGRMRGCQPDCRARDRREFARGERLT
jgi:hypothetical protein